MDPAHTPAAPPRAPATAAALEAHYRAYLALLNARGFRELGRFVAPAVVHNGRALGLAGYAALILDGAHFDARDVVADAAKRTVAARLYITFPHPDTRAPHAVDELVVYRLDAAGRIVQVWSMVEDAHFGD